MSKNNPPISAEGATWIMEQVGAGAATWDEAVSVLREFVRQEAAGQVDPLLTRHIARAISRFLLEAESIDEGDPNQRLQACAELLKGLGLRKESKGRPKLDQDDGVDVALAVLEECLQGCSTEVAVTRVAELSASVASMSEKQVRAACVAHMEDAIEKWRHKCGVAWPPNAATPEDEVRIAEIRYAFGRQVGK